MTARTATPMDVHATVYGAGAHMSIAASYTAPRPDIWDSFRIRETVEEKYISSKLPRSGGWRSKLKQPVGFGDLTDETYMEWIMNKSPRMFLILCDINIPERMFPIIDESFDDNDLPLTLEAIERLNLAPPPGDAVLNRAFFKKQFKYSLRELEEGQHIDYINAEEVPVITEETKNSIVLNNNSDKVYLPNVKKGIFLRKRVQLNNIQTRVDGMMVQDFMAEIKTMRSVHHPHIVSLFGSYTRDDGGFLLYTPVCELDLGTFLNYPPYTWKVLTKDQRRRQLLNWIHCLANALAYLHHQVGITHGEITPSSIVINPDGNNILFSSIGNTRKLDPHSYLSDKESYDYSAPEYWPDISKPPASPSTVRSGRSGFLSFRRSSSSTPKRTSSDRGSVLTVSTVISEFELSVKNCLRPLSNIPDPARADVFSIGCVIMDIVGFICKKKTSASASHRSANNPKKLLPFGKTQADSSFHANLDRVHDWASLLRQDCMKNDKDDLTLRRIIVLCQETLTSDIPLRPDSRDLSAKIHGIVLKDNPRESTHCGLDFEAANDNSTAANKVWEPLPMSTYEHPCYAEARKFSFLEKQGGIPLLKDVPATTPVPVISIRESASDSTGSSQRSSSCNSTAAATSNTKSRTWRRKDTAEKQEQKKKELIKREEREEEWKRRRDVRRYAAHENREDLSLWGSSVNRGGWGW